MYRVWSRAKAAGHAESHQLPCSSQFITLDWFYDPPLVPLFCGWGIFFFHTRFYMHTHTHCFVFFSDKNKNLLLLFLFFLFYCCTHSRTTVKQKCVVSRSLSQLVDRNGWFRDWVFGFVQSASSSSPPTKNPDLFFFFSLVGGRRDVHTQTPAHSAGAAHLRINGPSEHAPAIRRISSSRSPLLSYCA